MKIASFNEGRIGVVEGDSVIDLTDILAIDTTQWPPMQMVKFIRDDPRQRLAALDLGRCPRLPVSTVRLEAPILWPNKLMAFPVNYVAHGEEMSSANRADLNGFFLKAASSLSGPNDPIVLPETRGVAVHHECELGLVIGKQGKNIQPEDAYDYIFGYTCLIDVTVRSKHERVMRKSYDTFCPTGPWIITSDEVPNPQNLEMKLWVNGELRQYANTKNMILDIPGMIEMASSVATLHPGDIIATGTPEGVGPITSGDSIRIAIEHVGEMQVPVQ